MVNIEESFFHYETIEECPICGEKKYYRVMTITREYPDTTLQETPQPSNKIVSCIKCGIVYNRLKATRI